MSASGTIEAPSESSAVPARAGHYAAKRKLVASSKTQRSSYSTRYAKICDLSDSAIQTLGELCQRAESEAVRLAAAREILDRVDGKPRQAVTVQTDADMSALHLDALRALAAQAPDLIDITPSQTDG